MKKKTKDLSKLKFFQKNPIKTKSKLTISPTFWSSVEIFDNKRNNTKTAAQQPLQG